MKLNHRFQPARTLRAALLAAFTLISSGALQAANFFDGPVVLATGTIDMLSVSGSGPSRSNCWAIFALQGGVTITNPSDPGAGAPNVIGNVGISPSGTLTMQNARIGGGTTNLSRAYLQSGATASTTGSTVAGGIFQSGAVDTMLMNAQAAAYNASSVAGSLASQTSGLTLSVGFPTPPSLANGSFADTGSIVLGSTSQTINGAAGGTYVLNLANLVLTAGTLTLTGDSTTNYVINVSKFMSLSANSHIVLSGGLQASNVLFNVRNTYGYDVTMSGASTVDGIILAANRNVKLTGASVVTGEVIARGVSLSGNSRVINPVCSP
jgi:hypothetical protein